MTFSTLLNHSCTIKRPTRTQTASGDVAESLTNVATNSQGRLIMKSQEEVGQSSDQLKTVYHWYCFPSVDILQTDQITDIKLEDGTYLQTSPNLAGNTSNATFRVEQIFVRRGMSAHHKIAVLEAYE